MKRCLNNKTILFLIFVLCGTTLFAQKGNTAKTSSTGHVYGKVLDPKTKESVPFASAFCSTTGPLKPRATRIVIRILVAIIP